MPEHDADPHARSTPTGEAPPSSTPDLPVDLVRWQALDASLQGRVRSLAVPPEQIAYAGTIERAIATCEAADPGEVAGLAILRAGAPVGFVVLRRGSQRPDWAPEGAVALTAMRIEAREQGKGLGSAALRAVERWVVRHWPEQTIALSVDDGNHAGRRAYAKAGYTEFAEPRQGRIDLVRYLSRHVAANIRNAGT